MEEWVDLPDLELETAEAASDDPAWEATTVSALLPTELSPEIAGEHLYVKWRAEDGAGSGGRDESAIDSISVEIGGY